MTKSMMKASSRSRLEIAAIELKLAASRHYDAIGSGDDIQIIVSGLNLRTAAKQFEYQQNKSKNL